jgi:hypothetical protein
VRFAGAVDFPPDGFVLDAIGLPGLVAAAAFARTRAAAGGFNRFVAALCDSPDPAFRLCFLPDLPAFAPGVCEGRDFADFTVCARAALRGAGLGDFLRVFLDIRLPFVAFAGSIRGIAGLVAASRIRAGRWASLMASEYAYKVFDARPVRPLTALLGRLTGNSNNRDQSRIGSDAGTGALVT